MTSLKLTGIGLRPAHYQAFLQALPKIAWLEVHSENYFAEETKPNQILEKIRKHYPISLHGVGLSLGSTDELNWQHLKKLRDLIQRIEPCLVSEHLAWASVNGHYFHDLLPLPYTEEAIQHVSERIQQTQDYLQRQILIENISSYISFTQSTYTEWEFLIEVAKRSQCGILLDINNIYVNAKNLNIDALAYLQAVPKHLVQEFHLAGHSISQINDREVLIDSHSSAIAPDVWDLFQQAIQLVGRKPTIIEWDQQLPSLDILCEQAQHAENRLKDIYEFADVTD